jgi:hypothetical protein
VQHPSWFSSTCVVLQETPLPPLFASTFDGFFDQQPEHIILLLFYYHTSNTTVPGCTIRLLQANLQLKGQNVGMIMVQVHWRNVIRLRRPGVIRVRQSDFKKGLADWSLLVAG